MKLSYFLNKECIILDLKPGDKKAVITQMVDKLYESTKVSEERYSKEKALDALMKREEEESTALGEGMAFPHARVEGLQKSYTILAFSKQGIDFDSIDKKPTHFFIFSLVSQNQPNVLIKTRAVISKYLSDESVKKLLLGATDIDEIWKLIETSNVEIGYDVTARDLIEPQLDWLSPNTLLKDAAKELRRCQVDSLPVLNEQKELVGILSCRDLFSYHMPDFFFYMQKSTFIKHMDPFQEYFKVDDKINISTVMSTDSIPTIDPNKTLMEVIYEMIVNRKELLYVIEDKKLMGVINRLTIIEKVLVAV